MRTELPPLITEVSHYISFMIHFLDHFNFLSSISLNPSSHLQALQKIHLVNHIRWIVDLLHTDAVQQLEVALLGSPASEVIDLLSSGLVQTTSSTIVASAQSCLCTFTSTCPAPPLTSVLVVGVSTSSTSSHVPVVPPVESMSDDGEATPPKAKTSRISDDSKCHHITPILISPLPSTSSISLPVVVVPELAIPVEEYPEHINRPSGGKDYLCHLCPFRHSNLDSILTHIRKHLDVIIGCPICCRGYQNAASLCKHGRDIHSIQIMVSSTYLQEEI